MDYFGLILVLVVLFIPLTYVFTSLCLYMIAKRHKLKMPGWHGYLSQILFLC